MLGDENSPEFIALLREAGIAAELLASGVTALGKASASQHGWYNQAFFNLSIGFERAAKLVIIVNHCLIHGGAFPSDEEIRKQYGHDINALLGHANAISRQRRLGQEHADLPSTEIHTGIIETLTEFARVTRYYNLDLLTQGRGRTLSDPLATWMARVGRPILEIHYAAGRREADQRQAEELEQLMGDHTLIRRHDESRTPISTLEAGFMHGRQTKIVQKYGQVYTLQIARFLAHLLAELSYQSHQPPQVVIPDFSEFFAIFLNDDSYFKGRRTWSIYPR